MWEITQGGVCRWLALGISQLRRCQHTLRYEPLAFPCGCRGFAPPRIGEGAWAFSRSPQSVRPPLPRDTPLRQIWKTLPACYMYTHRSGGVPVAAGRSHKVGQPCPDGHSLGVEETETGGAPFGRSPFAPAASLSHQLSAPL